MASERIRAALGGHPRTSEGDIARGVVVPRATAFQARVPPGERSPCC